jgi:hypothetical protein
MSKNEDKLKHLEFIQLTIVRMAANSFILKGWTVTISAALFALAAKDTDPRFAFIALFAAAAFWGLDAYYLRQERLFRELYNDVRKSVAADTESYFSMATTKYTKRVSSWFRTLFSFTILGLHGAIVLTLLIFIAVSNSDKITRIWHEEHFSVSTTSETSHGQTSSETAGLPKTELRQGSGTHLSGKTPSGMETMPSSD